MDKQLNPLEDPVIEYGKPIWNKLFLVRIPNKSIPTTDEIKMFGLPSVMDPVYDHQMQNMLIDVMIPINKMIDYFQAGVTVRVVKHTDTKVIFDIIDKYLLAWKHKLDRGINIAIAPLDDLLVLDRFAGVIYPHARDHMKPTDSITSIINSFGGLGSKMIPLELRGPVMDHVQETKETYNSLAEILSERVIGRANNTVNKEPDTNKPSSNNEGFSFKHRWE